MKRITKNRKKKRELVKDFLKKNLKNWKEKTKQQPIPNRYSA
ncbi:hypothetical protein [Halalkalibacter oceani]|nr:hypothetical protein [Halalkalibacter oceani]